MANSPPEMDVTFITTCEQSVKPNQCAKVPIGTPVTFTTELNIAKCLDNEEPHTVSIFPIGLNENLTISVESACDYDRWVKIICRNKIILHLYSQNYSLQTVKRVWLSQNVDLVWRMYL